MTAQEWAALPKEPGMILYTSDKNKKCGELSSYIQYGATLKFTKGDACYAEYSYFPFSQLGVTKEAAEPKPLRIVPVKPMEAEEAVDAEVQSKNAWKRIRVKCVETGEVFQSITEAAIAKNIPDSTIVAASQEGRTTRAGLTFIRI